MKGGVEAFIYMKIGTNMDNMVGKFNVVYENRKLLIANEMKNCGDVRIPNIDALNSIIATNYFNIYEKYIHKHNFL